MTSQPTSHDACRATGGENAGDLGLPRCAREVAQRVRPAQRVPVTVVHVGPGWLYVGALSAADRVEAQRVTVSLLRLWHARRLRGAS